MIGLGTSAWDSLMIRPASYCSSMRAVVSCGKPNLNPASSRRLDQGPNEQFPPDSPFCGSNVLANGPAAASPPRNTVKRDRHHAARRGSGWRHGWATCCEDGECYEASPT